MQVSGMMGDRYSRCYSCHTTAITPAATGRRFIPERLRKLPWQLGGDSMIRFSPATPW